MIWTVTLELPECDGEDAISAVLDFQSQADQKDLFVYRATNDSTGETFLVDMADRSVTKKED